jgi:DNA invertase Pin-like site-specific DNA recombinase
MSKIKNAPGKEGNENQQHKDNEIQRVYEYLKKETATATMAAVALNIYRPNLCRRKRTLQKAGHLIEVKKGYCPITKRNGVQFLTTNPVMMPINSKLKLF